MTTLHNILTGTAGSWNLAADRSVLSFRNKTMWGLATVTGTFTEFSGDGKVADGVTGSVRIRATSLQTGIGKRDAHLRSADFFDVDNHPDITVEASKAEPSGDDAALLQTTLTVRGVSRAIELPVSVRVLDDGAVQVSGHCTVERGDFGVSGNMLGMVGPKTDLSADLVFVRV
ncbi:YceI family protein [Mycobacterium sp. 21AC1]|uniref:YceI family protein n=1 Tax=[Mycobacterium] appelbergii TaxID=2939269 RepID=UPI0029390CC8|nr:YceI family protein [Mycobacterium sp. 21AC1]MDV3126691.1 YceI family protein [Mycobacterium sp. 21AC1]